MNAKTLPLLSLVVILMCAAPRAGAAGPEVAAKLPPLCEIVNNSLCSGTR